VTAKSKKVAETKVKKSNRQAARADRGKAKHAKATKIAKNVKLARARTM
jgi:hypothetical protein